MTISIIIPVYKSETYIRRCVESVIEQESDTYTIECILVDDCSPDKSMEIAEEVVEKYKGDNISFVLLRHEKNKGVSAARNTAISVSTGDFLFFLDSDDEITENALKYLFSFILDHPHVDMVMGNMLWMEQKFLSNAPVTSNKNTPYMIEDKAMILEMVLRRKIDRHVMNKLIRRSIILENQIYFDEKVSIFEDVIWTYRIFSSLSSMLIAPAFTYKYELNSFSIMHTTAQRAKLMVDSLIIVSEHVFRNPPILNGKIIHYVAHRLFVFHWLIKAIDVNEQFHLNSDLYSRFISLRRAMFIDALKHVRPFLALFFLIMYAPLRSLIKFRWFRSNLYKIEKVVYQIS